MTTDSDNTLTRKLFSGEITVRYSLSSDFPSDYIVVDIETTGLDAGFDEITEIAAIKVNNNMVVDTFTSLINAGKHVPGRVVNLTGINDAMLKDAPPPETVLPIFIDFVGNLPIIAHNSKFDAKFIFVSILKYLNKTYVHEYVDTLEISRKLNRELDHHRLKDLVEFYGLKGSTYHRALADADMTNQCYQKMRHDIFGNGIVLSQESQRPEYISAKDIVPSKDESKNLAGLSFVFTGVFEKQTKYEYMQYVVDHGGEIFDKLSPGTNYLVIGNRKHLRTVKDSTSSKINKVEALNAEGANIEKLNESEFIGLLRFAERQKPQ